MITNLLTNTDAFHFINSGIACFAFSFLIETELGDLLKNNSLPKLNDFDSLKHFPSIKGAVLTLEQLDILHVSNEGIRLTDLGHKLVESYGILRTLFCGYGQLMLNQSLEPSCALRNPGRFINNKEIVSSAIDYGNRWVDPIINQILNSINLHGGICDLGCGIGHRLSAICSKQSTYGLGIDNDQEAIDTASTLSKSNNSILWEKQDILNLSGCWKNIHLAMQAFVFHDFETIDASLVLDNLPANFPKLEYLIYTDIVSSKSITNPMFPGFDYVHGLLGKSCRNYSATIDMFLSSPFIVIEEHAIDGLPNTYTWLLKLKGV